MPTTEIKSIRKYTSNLSRLRGRYAQATKKVAAPAAIAIWLSKYSGLKNQEMTMVIIGIRMIMPSVVLTFSLLRPM